MKDRRAKRSRWCISPVDADSPEQIASLAARCVPRQRSEWGDHLNGTTSLAIYESEIRVMAGSVYESGHLETGGYLYGAYTNEATIVVMLATLSGPEAQHRREMFVGDLAQVMRDNAAIGTSTGSIIVGRYHGHPCGLTHPSSIDDDSRASLLRKNPRQAFLELILCPDTTVDGAIRLFAYACMGNSPGCLLPCDVISLSGYSPIRTFLRGSQAVPAEDDRHIFSGARVVIDPMLPPRADAFVSRLSAEVSCLPEWIAETVEVAVSRDEIVVSMEAYERVLRILYTPDAPHLVIRAAVRDVCVSATEADEFAVPAESSLSDITAMVGSRRDDLHGQGMSYTGNEWADAADDDEGAVTPVRPACNRLGATATHAEPEPDPDPTLTSENLDMDENVQPWNETAVEESDPCI